MSVDLTVRFMIYNSDYVYYSLAFVMLLRRRYIPAVVCIGVSSFPFRAHAWVEISGVVVSGDEEIVRGLYSLKSAYDYE
ncbi:MAG: lasso peptide biosynthesis B2 protein [Candidatus Poribacteria bacterium]|nr:lasso peptide biosynthesis B2 protein [Candidatus Poribacteria bacterium]